MHLADEAGGASACYASGPAATVADLAGTDAEVVFVVGHGATIGSRTVAGKRGNAVAEEISCSPHPHRSSAFLLSRDGVHLGLLPSARHGLSLNLCPTCGPTVCASVETVPPPDVTQRDGTPPKSGTIDCYGCEQPNHGRGIFRIPQMPDESASIGDRRAPTGHLLRRHRGTHIVYV
jgi:hypothetical protein